MNNMIKSMFSLLFPALVACPHALGADTVSRVEVRVAPLAILAGGRLPVAVCFKMDQGWHTYAEDPGDSGMPPEIVLKTPAGVRYEKWRFPPARKFAGEAGTTYGYEGQVVLLGAVHIPESLADGERITLTLEVKWMVCRDVCVLLKDEVTLTLRQGTGPSVEESSDWERYLEAGGWSACVEPEQKGAKPEKEEPCKKQ